MFKENYSRFYINIFGENNSSIKGYAKFETQQNFVQITINLIGISETNSPYKCYLINCKENQFETKYLGDLNIDNNKGILYEKVDNLPNINVISIINSNNEYIATGYKGNKALWKPRFEETILINKAKKLDSKPLNNPENNKIEKNKQEVNKLENTKRQKEKQEINTLILNNEICDEYNLYNEIYLNKIKNLEKSFQANFETIDFFDESLNIKWWKVEQTQKLISILDNQNYKHCSTFITNYTANYFSNEYIIGLDFNENKYYLICGIKAIYSIDPKPQNFDCSWYEIPNKQHETDMSGYWIVGIEL